MDVHVARRGEIRSMHNRKTVVGKGITCWVWAQVGIMLEWIVQKWFMNMWIGCI